MKHKPQSIVVVGRKWFQRSAGNTYHTASIIVDGKLVHHTAKEYGYGDQYVQTAERWLVENEIVPPPEKYSNGMTETFWRHMDKLGIAFHREAIAVACERDL